MTQFPQRRHFTHAALTEPLTVQQVTTAYTEHFSADVHTFMKRCKCMAQSQDFKIANNQTIHFLPSPNEH